MGKPDLLKCQNTVESRFAADGEIERYKFLWYDTRYRPVVLDRITNQRQTLDRYTIVWDGNHNPAYIPL